MSKLFRCPQCHKVAMSIFRYMKLPPLGICGYCKCVKELGIKELESMIKTVIICDKCESIIKDGTGYKMNFDLVDKSNGKQAKLEWDLCNNCGDTIHTIFTEPEVMDKLIKGTKISKGLKESWAKRKPTVIIDVPTEDNDDGEVA